MIAPVSFHALSLSVSLSPSLLRSLALSLARSSSENLSLAHHSRYQRMASRQIAPHCRGVFCLQLSCKLLWDIFDQTWPKCGLNAEPIEHG